MTNYKRFITYLYYYESGKKMGNVGFARVETSDEMGKVTIHCSTKVVSEKECKVYLLKRTKSMTVSKQVATANAQNGNLDIKLSFDGGRVNDSEFNLKDTQGIVILYSKDNYIAAKWDDSSVSYHEVILLEQEEEMQQPIPKIEVAQVEKSEEKVSELQPKIVVVDAADIINLGKVSDIKKVVDYNEDSIIPVELKSETRKDQVRKEDDNKVKEENISFGEVVQSSIEESKTTESNVVESKVNDRNEFNEKEIGKGNAVNMAFERNINNEKNINVERNNIAGRNNITGRNMRSSLDNLPQTQVVTNEKNAQKSQEARMSIKDMIRENIRAEKEKEKEKEIEQDFEKENENFASEDIIASNEPLTEETPIDDTELKDEELHAANCAVPNPNLWADHPSARAILNRFVRMYPFDDGEIAECVRLEPKDIGLLPMSAWVLGNNSFLLHSYCNFRHLLFAKKLTREGCVYLLMVPGAHNNREQQLAKMFGFENFKCSRRRSMRDGEFGYWYVPIVFE